MGIYKVIAYHGSKSGNIESFDLNKVDLGFHFGTFKQAEKKINGKGFIYKVELSLEKTLRIKDPQNDSWQIFYNNLYDGFVKQNRLILSDWKELGTLLYKKNAELFNQGIKSIHGRSSIINNILITEFIELGYDSLVYENEYEGQGDSYILFNPKRIKILFKKQIRD